eukprot:g1617.t1
MQAIRNAKSESERKDREASALIEAAQRSRSETRKTALDERARAQTEIEEQARLRAAQSERNFTRQVEARCMKQIKQAEMMKQRAMVEATAKRDERVDTAGQQKATATQHVARVRQDALEFIEQQHAQAVLDAAARRDLSSVREDETRKQVKVKARHKFQRAKQRAESSERQALAEKRRDFDERLRDLAAKAGEASAIRVRAAAEGKAKTAEVEAAAEAEAEAAAATRSLETLKAQAEKQRAKLLGLLASERDAVNPALGTKVLRTIRAQIASPTRQGGDSPGNSARRGVSRSRVQVGTTVHKQVEMALLLKHQDEQRVQLRTRAEEDAALSFEEQAVGTIEAAELEAAAVLLKAQIMEDRLEAVGGFKLRQLAHFTVVLKGKLAVAGAGIGSEVVEAVSQRLAPPSFGGSNDIAAAAPERRVWLLSTRGKGKGKGARVIVEMFSHHTDFVRLNKSLQEIMLVVRGLPVIGCRSRQVSSPSSPPISEVKEWRTRLYIDNATTWAEGAGMTAVVTCAGREREPQLVHLGTHPHLTEVLVDAETDVQVQVIAVFQQEEADDDDGDNESMSSRRKSKGRPVVVKIETLEGGRKMTLTDDDLLHVKTFWKPVMS